MRIFSFPSSVLRAATWMMASVLLAGCATYGSFDENEPGIEESIFGDIVGVVGSPSDAEPIDYSARAPLVSPPSTTALPAPQTETAAADDPQWPTGSRERMAQVLASEDQTLVFTPGVDGVDIAATQALADRQRQTPERNVDVGRALTPAEMRLEQDIHLARQQASAQRDADGVVRGRRFLTDPPVSARAPSPEAPYNVDAEEVAEAEEGGFDWWPF